jgi:hypothetical protein
MFSSLVLLLLEIIWYNILKICLVAVAIGVTIIAKNRNNNGQNNQRINEQQPVMRQRQEQHQATNVVIQTNGEEPVTITSRSTTNTPTTMRRDTKNRPTTSTPTTSKGTFNRRTSVNFLRRDTLGETSSAHSSRDSSEDDSEARIKTTRRKSLRISRKSMLEEQRKTAAENEWCKQNSDEYRKSSTRNTQQARPISQEQQSMVLRDRSSNSANTRAVNVSTVDMSQQPKIHITTGIPINVPSPAKFNPNIDVNEWILDMENYICLVNASNRKKSVYLAFLTPAVREKVNERSLSADEAIAAEQIKERLINLYAKPGKTTSDYVREFNQRTQSTNENVRMFCADLESICQRAFPDTPNLEQYIIGQFTEGVANRQCKTYLRINVPNTVKEMVEIATKYENAHIKDRASERDTSTTRGHYQAPQPQTSGQQQQTPQRQSSSNPIIGNYDKTKAAMQNQGQSTEGRTYSLRDRSATQPPDRYDANANAQRIARPCYNCQSTDHVIRDCPTRPAARSNQNNNQQLQPTSINNV